MKSYFKNQADNMMIQIFVVVGISLVIYKIMQRLACKDIQDKKMKCPSCHSNLIFPVTDALWGCENCKDFFSANSIL